MPWTLKMTLLFALIMVLLFVFSSFSFMRAVTVLNLQPKSIYFLGLCLLCLNFLIYPLLGWAQYSLYGEFSSDVFHKSLIYLFWYGFIFSAVLLSWTIFLELFVWTIKNGFKINPPELDPLAANLMIIVIAVVALFTMVKIVWHTHHIKVTGITYNLSEKTGRNISPLKVVLIADLQSDRYTTPAKTKRYIDKINKQNPDVVLFAGDLVTSGKKYIEEGAQALGNINARYGTFAIIGDHDYWSGENEIVQALQNNGVTVLRDQNHWFVHEETKVKITGVTEIYHQKTDDETLNNLLTENRDEEFRILLSHQGTIRLIEAAKENGYHQLLAGHTHGGQIRIPFFFYSVTAARIETRYVKGKKHFGNLMLHINNGLGFTLAPVRYNATAQVSVIHVK
jgi:predicted MPP superfamily phosphohydrolase